MRLSQSYLMFRASFKHACADMIPNIGQQRSSSDPAVVAKYRGSPIPSHPKPTSQCTSPMSQQTKKFSYTIVVSTKHHGTRQTGGAREQERPLLHKHAQRKSSAHTAIPCISRCHGLHSHPGSGARWKYQLSRQVAGQDKKIINCKGDVQTAWAPRLSAIRIRAREGANHPSGRP